MNLKIQQRLLKRWEIEWVLIDQESNWVEKLGRLKMLGLFNRGNSFHNKNYVVLFSCKIRETEKCIKKKKDSIYVTGNSLVDLSIKKYM